MSDDLFAPATVEQKPDGFFVSLRRMVPQSEVIRFLIVGAWNTGFALILYFICVHAFLLALPGRPKLVSDLAYTVSTPVGITMAFLCYKRFVFKTQGNWLKEWLRCFAVYSVSFPVGLVILPVATGVLSHWTTRYAPQGAGLVNSAVIAIYSYFGHKKFSFKK